MGVVGLWKLLEGSGHPVTLESLEGKTVAVDISIWLNMAVKGMRDFNNSSNPHLVTLFHRICKLLHFGIKPIFVFDGQAPMLKIKTIQDRRQKMNLQKQNYQVASEKMLQNYLKKEVLKLAISKKSNGHEDENQTKSSSVENEVSSVVKQSKKLQGEEDNLFVLPPMKNKLETASSGDEIDTDWKLKATIKDSLFVSSNLSSYQDLMSLDIESDDFKSLPPDIQHEMLSDLKEIKKRRRTMVESMPDTSESFSSFQLSGLLAKKTLSSKIKAVEKCMEERNTASMAQFAIDEGYQAQNISANKISSEDTAHYILIRGLRSNPNKELTQQPSSVEHVKTCDSQPDSSPSKTSTYIESPIFNELITSNSESDDNVPEITETGNKILLSETTTNSCHLQDIKIPKDVLSEPAVHFDNQRPTHLANPQGFQIEEQSPNTDISITEATPANIPKTETQSKQTAPLEQIKPRNMESMLKTKAISIESQKDVRIPVASTSKYVSIPVISASSDSDNIDEFEDVAQPLDISEAVLSNSNVREPNQIDDISSNNLNDGPSLSQEVTPAEKHVNPWEGVTQDDLSRIGDDLDREDVILLEKMQSAARASRDISDTATTECQELLQLFGIPYITSPQEAEAQCAFLDKKGLTCGTMTEDSDIWPFGGTVTYKDVFDRKREPKCYKLIDIKTELGLQQHHFINIALLSGSDYTTGVEGVGPVRGLEVMKEFPGDGIESLKAFKTWWMEAHKQVKSPPSETKIKSQLRRINLPPSFPSDLVVQAYLEPKVNESLEQFTWGYPDLDGLRNFAQQKLHWTRKKVDSDLLPILKRFAERRISQQPLISSFLPRRPCSVQQTKKSKRVQRAIAPLVKSDVKPQRKRKATKSNTVIAKLKKEVAKHSQSPDSD